MHVKSGILVIANLNMDLILEQRDIQQTGRKKYADSFCLSPGGNGNNEAVAAARLGVPVALAGMVGSDSFGKQLKESLDRECANSELVQVTDTSTGLSLILSSAGQENAYWDIAGANACVDEAYIRSLEPRIAEARLLVVGFGIPFDSAVLAMELAGRHSTEVMLVAYQSRPLREELLSMIDMLVLDSREAAALTDVEVTNLKSARIAAGTLLKRGIRQAVLVHMKSRFLLTATNGGFTALAAPRDFRMIDASAMDDTLAGVFAACHVKGIGTDRAAEISYAAANLCGSRFGAQNSIPSSGELSALMA